MLYEGGYDWYSGMSNRAVRAYQEGKRPLSRITLNDLREVGWTGTKKAAMALITEGHWKPCEWHHTSKHFNRTQFYDLAEAVDIQQGDTHE